MIAIWSGGIAGLADPADVGSVAAAGEAWRLDVEQLGPWRRDHLPGVVEPVWVAAGDDSLPWILVAGACSSCMDVAWRLQETGSFPAQASVVAVRQWAGRGQLGRCWTSPPGNLYGAWRLAGADSGGPGLPVVLGYAILTALQERGVSAELKWPNDVLVAGRKVAGVLCEQRGPFVMAGIGVNLESYPGPEAQRDGHAVAATALADHAVAVRPLELWKQVLAAAGPWLAPAARSRAMGRIEPHLAYRGRRVEVRPGSGPTFEAAVDGLEPDGALRVRTAAGVRRIVSAGLALAE